MQTKDFLLCTQMAKKFDTAQKSCAFGLCIVFLVNKNISRKAFTWEKDKVKAGKINP